MNERFGEHVFHPKKIILNEVDEKVKQNIYKYYTEKKSGKNMERLVFYTYYAYLTHIWNEFIIL